MYDYFCLLNSAVLPKRSYFPTSRSWSTKTLLRPSYLTAPSHSQSLSWLTMKKIFKNISWCISIGNTHGFTRKTYQNINFFNVPTSKCFMTINEVTVYKSMSYAECHKNNPLPQSVHHTFPLSLLLLLPLRHVTRSSWRGRLGACMLPFGCLFDILGSKRGCGTFQSIHIHISS